MAGPPKEVTPNLRKDTKSIVIEGLWEKLMAISDTLLYYIFIWGFFNYVVSHYCIKHKAQTHDLTICSPLPSLRTRRCLNFESLGVGIMDLEPQNRSVFPGDYFINFSSIKNMEDLEKVSKEIVWQNFEKLTAFVFEENNFRVETNAVKTLKKKKTV